MSSKIKFLLFAILAITMTSCDEDFLERTPTDAISASEALANENNMQLIIDGLHRSLFSQSQTIFSGGSTQRAGNHYWVPLGDLLSGGIIHSANANNLGWRTEMQWNSHTLPTSLTSRILWHHRYNTILGANILINRITEGVADGSLVETNTLNGILGQAYTYRGYAYLSLVQHYARGYLIGNPSSDPGVPLLFSSEVPFTSEPRSTVQEVYTQIESDLNLAITTFENAGLAAPGGGAGAAAKSQLNVNVAYGLLARTHLSKGEWQAAADAAVMAREGYPLMGEADWKSGFNTNELSEVIWGSNVIAPETTFFRSYFYLMSNTFNGSQVRNNPKIADRRVVDAIPDTDYRKDVFIINAPNTNTSAANNQGGFGNDPNFTDEDEFNAAVDSLNAVYGITTRFNLHPYMHFKMKNANPGSIDPDDVIYMRSSEMYLIEAEAMAMMGDIPGAQEALRPLGEERDSAYDVTVFNTQEAMMDHIKFQRRVELWGEGFGYTDHIRWDEGIDHEADGGSGASAVLYQEAYQVERPSVNDDWIFKIPQQEIDANPNLTPADQN